MISRDDLDHVLESGGRLLAADGTDLGSIDQLVLDSSGAPAFVSVRAGFFGIAQRFVPLDGASLDGSAVRVAFDGELVRSAPTVTADRGGLGENDATAVREHFGLPGESGSERAEGSSAEAESTRDEAAGASGGAAAESTGAQEAVRSGDDRPVSTHAHGQSSDIDPEPHRPPPLRHPGPPHPPPHPGPPHPGPPHPGPPHPGPPPPPPPAPHPGGESSPESRR
jgi:hypothetical protein